MASIKVVLDTRRMKQDQTYPVILRVINNGKSTSVYEYGNKVTGIYLNHYADSVIDEVNQKVTG